MNPCWVSILEACRFGLVTQQAIRRCSLSNVKELTRKINTLEDQSNARASPFAWVATAESIPANMNDGVKPIAAQSTSRRNHPVRGRYRTRSRNGMCIGRTGPEDKGEPATPENTAV